MAGAIAVVAIQPAPIKPQRVFFTAIAPVLQGSHWQELNLQRPA